MKEGGEASDKPIDNAVLSRMKQFRAMNKMKKLALKVPQIFQQCINLNEIYMFKCPAKKNVTTVECGQLSKLKT